MSRCKLKYLFCVQMLLLCNASPPSIRISGRKLRKISFHVSQESKPGPHPLSHCAPLTPGVRQVIDVVFVDSTGKEQHTILTRVEDCDLIDRATTGIFFAESDTNAYHDVKYTPRPDFFDNIGEFENFQNPEDLSSLTRFTNSSSGEVTYSGILKDKYVLEDVPSDFHLSEIKGQNRIVNKTIRNRNPNSMIVVDNEDPAKDAVNGTTQQSSQQIRSPPAVIYPKLLLSPSFNLMNRAKSTEHFVKHIIAILNNEDMLHRQLRDPQIHLHISGIIIPLDKSATPYIIAFPDRIYVELDTFERTENYFLTEMQRFPFHTYDIVVSMAEKNFAKNLSGQVTAWAGSKSGGTVCARGNGYFGATVAVARGYFTGAIDSRLKGAHWTRETLPGCDESKQSTKAHLKLKWSPCQPRINHYLKSEKAACMHSRPVAMPESIKNTQGAWLPIAGQCQNLFKDAEPGFCLAGTIGNICASYGCMRNGTCLLNSNQPPMEGSICEGEKRCINRNCVDIPNHRSSKTVIRIKLKFDPPVTDDGRISVRHMENISFEIV